MSLKNTSCSAALTFRRLSVCKYSFSDVIGLFSSCVTLSIKFDCRRLRLIALIESVRYSAVPTIANVKKEAPIESRAI